MPTSSVEPGELTTTSVRIVPRILVADDQADVREALRLLLKAEGYAIETAASPAEVLSVLQKRELDVALIDLNYARDTTSGQEGLDLLTRLQAMDWTLPVVVMTAWASVEMAVEAMRRGARDFVAKPWENARLLSIVRTQAELGRSLRARERLEAENTALREQAPLRMIAGAPPCSRCCSSSSGSGPPTPTSSSPARTAPARAPSPTPCMPAPRARPSP